MELSGSQESGAPLGAFADRLSWSFPGGTGVLGERGRLCARCVPLTAPNGPGGAVGGSNLLIGRCAAP